MAIETVTCGTEGIPRRYLAARCHGQDSAYSPLRSTFFRALNFVYRKYWYGIRYPKERGRVKGSREETCNKNSKALRSQRAAS